MWFGLLQLGCKPNINLLKHFLHTLLIADLGNWGQAVYSAHDKIALYYFEVISYIYNH